jgi:hypothetical protein
VLKPQDLVGLLITQQARIKSLMVIYKSGSVVQLLALLAQVLRLTDLE